MPAFEVATVILPMFSVLQDQLRYTIFEAVTFPGVRRSFSSLWGQYGFLRAVLLLFIFPNAPEVISQIRDTLATSVDEDLMMIKKSLADDCNMMAVACAIVAQIAISALALDHLESTHWTAKGAFVVSLVTAGLSVFYGCLLQQKISSLLKARDLKNWLSRPGGQKERREVDVLIEKYLQVKRKHWNAGVEASSGEIGKPLEDARASITDFKDANSWKAVSFNAVIMTKVPTLLLKYSVGSFLVGFGIYLGFVASRNLDAPLSKHDSFYIFAVFMAVAVVGLLLYLVPMVMKMLESAPLRRWEALLNAAENFICPSEPSQNPEGNSNAASHSALGTDIGSGQASTDHVAADIRSHASLDTGLVAALERSVQAQEQCSKDLQNVLKELQKSQHRESRPFGAPDANTKKPLEFGARANLQTTRPVL